MFIYVVLFLLLLNKWYICYYVFIRHQVIRGEEKNCRPLPAVYSSSTTTIPPTTYRIMNSEEVIKALEDGVYPFNKKRMVNKANGTSSSSSSSPSTPAPLVVNKANTTHIPCTGPCKGKYKKRVEFALCYLCNKYK